MHLQTTCWPRPAVSAAGGTGTLNTFTFGKARKGWGMPLFSFGAGT